MTRVDKRYCAKFLQSLLIVEWLLLMIDTDSIYVCYLLLGLISFWRLLKEKENKDALCRIERIVVNGLAVFLSGLVALANYWLFSDAVDGFLCVGGSFVVWRQCLMELYDRMTVSRIPCMHRDKDLSRRVFACVFAGCSVINITALLLANYPGILSPDSLNQVEQIVLDSYDNHHPYWHTQLIGLFVRPCMALFNSVELGVALYCVAQILMMAGCFAYAAMTVYQAGAGIRCVMLLGISYTLLPYHILYSFTVWKDILFGGSVLLLVTALYRILGSIGGRKLNYAALLAGMMGMAVLRNNGWLALAASCLIWLVLFFRKRPAVSAAFAAVLAVSWVMCNPVLEKKGVENGNFRESLSIPIQQVARVLTYEGEITPEQRALIDRVIPSDEVAALYQQEISDPVKFEVDGEYIRENKLTYLKLWLEIGIQNPKLYLQAFVEQTKGYWNGGYYYWIWEHGVRPNELDIQTTVFSRFLRGGITKYAEMFLQWGVLIPLCCIGVHVWATGILMVLNFLRGRRELGYLAIPVLMVVGTLIVATPVFSEFRYAYAVFTVLPMYVSLSVFAKDR